MLSVAALLLRAFSRLFSIESVCVMFLACRIKDDPFHLTFELKHKNPTYTAGAAAGGEDSFTSRLVQPQDHQPAVYIDEYTAGQFAFVKADVTLDGIKIDSGNMEDQAIHYQKLNRVFTTDRVRRAKYGRSMKGVANSLERVIANPVTAIEGIPIRPAIAGDNNAVLQTAVANLTPYRPAKARYTHPSILKAMQPIVYDGVQTSQPTVMTLGMDGIWPLSSSSNALLATTSQANGCGFFPPGTKINITLFRRRTVSEAIERVAVTDTLYFGGADLADNLKEDELTIEFKSIEFGYETCVLAAADDIAKITKSDLKYYHDTPLMRTNQLLYNCMFEQVKVVLPRGTRFLYLLFLKDVQIAANARKHNYISTRHRFPPGLSSLKCNLLGKDGIVLKEGLVGMGVADGRASLSLRTFHANLVRKGLYEREFDDFFPPWRNNALGHEQAVPIDLTPYNEHFKTDPVNLVVQLKYDAVAIERWNLRSYALVQRCYTFSPRSRWTWSDLV